MERKEGKRTCFDLGVIETRINSTADAFVGNTFCIFLMVGYRFFSYVSKLTYAMSESIENAKLSRELKRLDMKDPKNFDELRGDISKNHPHID